MEKINVAEIYGDPILYDRRRGTPIDPFKSKKETIFIESNYALLSEIPNRYDRVKVTGLKTEWVETDDREHLEENYFWVDYTHGMVYFHGGHQGKTVNIEYTGEGIRMFPDSRVYFSGEGSFPTVRDKFEDVDRSILVQKSRVDELIRKNPQPSEVVDQRIDYNGKIFRVAKDRIDAEQKKIEEAYFDAKGKKFGSLKLRIDSLQMATEEHEDEQLEENTKLWASIDLIPGKIELETGKLEENINGDIRKLTSRIELVPEQISLKVEELRDSVDNEFYKAYSELDILSDEMNLKVNVDGVVSSINLSKEGVRVSGKKLWLDGDTRIDNATIKSAHIDSLSADKISAGLINADKISMHGGSSTEYLNIQGNELESRGQFTSTWFGETKKRDVKFQMRRGYFRARNDKENKSLYFSDYGISSFLRGYDEESDDYEYHGSGVIEFFSHQYSERARGITIFSNRGVVAMRTQTRDIVLDSNRGVKISADKGLVEIRGGLRSTSIGVLEPNTNFYVGVNGDGELRITNKNFYNSGSTLYKNVRARYYRGRAVIDRTRSSFLYLGSDLGVRITSRGINNNNNIIYRPIHASSFKTRSSRSSKENIADFTSLGTEIINDLKVVNFNYIGDQERKVGFIAEDSPRIASEDGEFIELGDLTAYLTKAIQELSAEVKELKRELSEKH